MVDKLKFKNYLGLKLKKLSFFHTIWRWVTSKTTTVVIKNDNAIDGKNDIAVLFIHGTLAREGCFKTMVEKLVHHLPENITSLHRLSFKNQFRILPISNYAEQLIEYAEQHNLKELILVGHSRGGNIAAYVDYLVKEWKKNITIHAVISLGSPLMGSNIEGWRIASIKPLHEMQSNSEFLAELNKFLDINDDKYYYFGAENDAIVSPRSACRNYQSKHHVVLKDENHLSLTTSPMLIKHIDEILHVIALETKQSA